MVQKYTYPKRTKVTTPAKPPMKGKPGSGSGSKK
jgi:hypothetical protein